MKRNILTFNNGSVAYISNVQWFGEIIGGEIGLCDISIDNKEPTSHSIWTWDDAESDYIRIENIDEDGDEYEVITIAKKGEII